MLCMAPGIMLQEENKKSEESKNSRQGRQAIRRSVSWKCWPAGTLRGWKARGQTEGWDGHQPCATAALAREGRQRKTAQASGVFSPNGRHGLAVHLE
jgi:hypothetical protein